MVGLLAPGLRAFAADYTFLTGWIFVSKRVVALIVGALLSIQAGLLIHSAKVHSPTWDEVGYLAAGLSHWELGRFELYSVNPPLVRTVASAPIHFFCNAPMDWGFYRSDPSLRSEVYLGRRMIELSGEDSLHHFFIARLAVIPIVLLGGWICFLWGRDLFGVYSGLIALAIWTFSPNVLGYGSVITPDLPSAVAMIGCSYVFWRWQCEGGWAWAITLGASMALAMLTKSVWLVFPVIFVTIWLVNVVFNLLAPLDKREHADSRGVLFSQLILASALSVILTNSFYGFQGSFRELGSYSFVSSAFSGVEVKSQPVLDCVDCEPPVVNPPNGNRFSGGLLGKIPVPLPQNYLQGIDIQTRDFERGRYDTNWKSYLLGEWKQGGWWYYYVVGLFVKVPLAIWGMLAMGSVVACFWRSERDLRFGVVCLWVPAIVLFAIASVSTGLNRYVRYCLPILPVIFIWAAQLGRLLEQRGVHRVAGRRLAASALSVAGVWLVISSLQNSPHHLSYFNEAAGGSGNGHRILCDSNVDWGQDLLLLRDWLDENPDAKRDLHLAYFGSFDPSILGVKFTLPPPVVAPSESAAGMLWTGPTPGWHVVSRNFVVGHSMPLPDGQGSLRFRSFGDKAYRYFSELEPTASIGQSMMVYNVSLDEANQLRRRLGLPLLVKNSAGVARSASGRSRLTARPSQKSASSLRDSI